MSWDLHGLCPMDALFSFVPSQAPAVEPSTLLEILSPEQGPFTFQKGPVHESPCEETLRGCEACPGDWIPLLMSQHGASSNTAQRPRHGGASRTVSDRALVRCVLIPLSITMQLRHIPHHCWLAGWLVHLQICPHIGINLALPPCLYLYSTACG